VYLDPNLPRHISAWYSAHLDIEMPIASYGEGGHPLLLFPVGDTDFLEYERAYLIKAIEPHILAGKVRVFSIDSINRHAWLNPQVHPSEAARRQVLYSRYVEEEVVPHIRRVISVPQARLATSGADLGAFHAANHLFRRPDLFDIVIGMSGLYDLEPWFTRGYFSDDIYFNNPVSFVANIHDEKTLHLLRHECQIHLVSGRGAGEDPSRSERLSRVLAEKGISFNLDLWGGDVDHSFTWWRKMLDYYIGHRLGW